MAAHVVPHFHNTAGVSVVQVGSKEFKCMGALPPFDHPHVFIDMGSALETICPYCSTLYRYSPALAEGQAAPASAVYNEHASAVSAA